MISQIRFAAPLAAAAPSAPAAAPSAPAAAPAKTTSDYSIVRKGIEGAAGLAGGFVGTTLNLIPSAVAGGIQGVSRRGDAAEVGAAQTIGLVVESTIGGAIAGGLAGGGVGVAIGVAAGLVGGLAYGSLQYGSKGAEQIGGAIKNKVDVAVSDNIPSGSKTKDVTKDFTEGLLVGGVAGGKASFSVGAQEASGVMSGLIEGTAGAAKVLIGSYDPTPAPQGPAQTHGVLGTIARIPRLLVRTGVGLAVGATSAVLNTVDGTVQGFVQGAGHEYRGEKHIHNAIMRVELFGAGVAAGAMLAGPLGGVLGAVGGLIAGGVVGRINKKTGADQTCVDYISLTVKSAAGDNAQSDSKIYTTFRDGVEGALVGTAAGAKAGFLTGFEGGKGAVDGVFDGIKGIVDGIIGAFKPTPKPTPQQPQQP